MPTGAPTARRDERAVGGRNIVRIYLGAVGHLLTVGCTSRRGLQRSQCILQDSVILARRTPTSDLLRIGGAVTFQ